MSSLLSWFNSPLFGFLLAYRTIFLALTYLKWTFVLSGAMTVNIRTIWTWQGALPAPVLLVQLWWTLQKGKWCQVPAFLHPKRPSGRSFSLFFLSLFFLHLFQFYCKTSSLILSIVISEVWWHYWQLPSSVLPPQTNSGPSQVPKRYPGPSSSLVR